MAIKILAVFILLSGAGCTEIQSPSYPPYGRYGYGGYPPYGGHAPYGGYYGGDRYAYYDRYYRRYPYDDDYRRGYKHKREHEHRRHERPPRVGPPSSGARFQTQQQCPAGFHRSTKRCTDAERRRGCKDIGLSGGVGCRNKPG